jgi:hypothetical protein
VGADLLTANLWSKREGEGPYDQFDWEAGLRMARELGDTECAALADQCGWEPGDDEAAPEEMRLQAVRYVETLRDNLTGFSRDLNVITTPDDHWACWVTGGLSWGDSPSELFDAINDLYAVPEVLAAIGFWTGGAEVDR